MGEHTAIYEVLVIPGHHVELQEMSHKKSGMNGHSKDQNTDSSTYFTYFHMLIL